VTESPTLNPTALLVIDVQEIMFGNDDEPPVHNHEQLIDNITLLLENARSAGAQVIYVRHTHPRFEAMQPGSPLWEIRAAIAPQAGETIIDKDVCDSFASTNLDQILRDGGHSTFVTCGIQTDYCVGSATRSGLNRGFNVILAGDSHSTWDASGLTAEQIIRFTNEQLADTSGPGNITVKNAADIGFASL
jgi:nicotinamidase-related amidase